MHHTFSKTFGLDELSEVAKAILDRRTSDIVLLHGPIGAGKTTLVKAILQQLKAVDQGTSPTYGLLNEYVDADGNLIACHLDAYRLNSEEEAFDLGLEEYWVQDLLFFIEWPEKLGQVLPIDVFRIEISSTPDGKRQVSW